MRVWYLDKPPEKWTSSADIPYDWGNLNQPHTCVSPKPSGSGPGLGGPDVAHHPVGYGFLVVPCLHQLLASPSYRSASMSPVASITLIIRSTSNRCPTIRIS